MVEAGVWKIVKNKDLSLYWADEDVVFNRTALAEVKSSQIVINTVITHSAPTQCFPTSKDGIKIWLEHDKNLEADLNAERLKLDQLLQQLDHDNHHITNWYYGHYHDSKIESIDGINYHLLNVMELKECISH